MYILRIFKDVFLVHNQTVTVTSQSITLHLWVIDTKDTKRETCYTLDQ